jgi:hypothetical protein
MSACLKADSGKTGKMTEQQSRMGKCNRDAMSECLRG